jgi:hypothetical protein
MEGTPFSTVPPERFLNIRRGGIDGRFGGHQCRW